MLKKYSLLFLFFISGLALVACGNQEINNQITLPNLSGMNREQIEYELSDLDLIYSFEEVIHNTIRTNRFVEYGNDYVSGMKVEPETEIIIYLVKYANQLPDLTGLNQDEITEVLSNYDLFVQFEYRASNTVQIGLFLSYEEGLMVGDILDLGLEITVYLAEPLITTLTLPNLNYLYASEIMDLLDLLAIYYAIEEIHNNDIPEGQFISYNDPYQAGDQILETDGIIIYVAKHVNMLPELEGLNQIEIYSELAKIDVVVEIQNIPTNDVEEGFFVSYGRNRVPGDIVLEGTSIIVYIATPIIEVNYSLMIKTYLEGTLFNRVLELYNTSDEVLDLSNYQIAHYIDGSDTTSSIIKLNGYLNPFQTYVIVHSNSDLALLSKADLITSNLIFNGNDAVAIQYFNNETIDIIGNIGWGFFYLEDQTFVRKAHIAETKTSFSVQDWDIYTKDYHEVIGNHPHDYPQTFTFDPYYLTIPFSEKGGMIKVDFISNNDGDTAQFTPGFTGENRVRFVGVDTPETGSGIVATQATQFVYNRLSKATSIYLQHDPDSGNIESYGRYLALIWADGVLLNYELVLNGYSQNNYYDSKYNLSFNGVSLSRWMTNAEDYAKTNRLGVWG